MRRWTTESVAETRELGRQLSGELRPDGLLLLAGDLGTGKTTLVQGVAAGLGIDPRQVQSPSYTLIREHEGPGTRLVHVDLYRLEPVEAAALGLEELLSGPGVKVVEWPDRLPFEVPESLRLELTRLEGDKRRIDEGAMETVKYQEAR